MRSTLWFLVALLFFGIAVKSGSAREWTDRATGRQIEAEFVGFSDGKVEIKRARDGKTFYLPIESLSDADQAFVRSQTSENKLPLRDSRAIASGKVQDATQRKRAYAQSPDMLQGLILLKAFELLPAGRQVEDFGRTVDIRVSDQLTVTGVPIEFLEKSTEAALIQVSALGLSPDFKDGAAFEKAVKEKKINSRAAAKALVAWWTAEILAEWNVDSKDKKVTSQELLQLDFQRTRALKSLGSSPDGALMATWLLFPQGLDSLSPTRQSRRPVSFQMLMERFAPDMPVTEENAEAISEELVWTRHINLSDATIAQLPDARRVLRALILERLGFEIGDPMDADLAKRQAARNKLAEAELVATKAWKAGAK